MKESVKEFQAILDAVRSHLKCAQEDAENEGLDAGLAHAKIALGVLKTAIEAAKRKASD